LQYYQHILAALPYADTVDKVEDLLPWNVELKKNARKLKEQVRALLVDYCIVAPA